MNYERLFRRVVIVLLLAIIAGVLSLMLGTQRGRRFFSEPKAAATDVKAYVARHPVIAPAAFVLVYGLVAVAGLPVWWLQVTAGFAFGLGRGIAVGAVAATLAAVGGAAISRFLFSDWFHQRVESRMARLRALDDRMGNNGLLVVLVLRLLHGVPFALCNYALGLTRVSLVSIAVGTLFGALPVVTIYATGGADAALVATWKFWAIIAAMHLVLLTPIVWRWATRRQGTPASEKMIHRDDTASDGTGRD